MAQNEQTDVAPDADPAVSDKPPVEEREPSPEPSTPARIIINPKVFKDKRDGLCVAYNEAFRVLMEMNGFDPQSEPTAEQRKFFSDTAYADDERMLRRTILARICTFDDSVKNPTDEQLDEALEFLETVMEIGAPQSEEEQANVQRIHDMIAEIRKAPRPEEQAEEPVEGLVESSAPPVAAVGGGMTFSDVLRYLLANRRASPKAKTAQPEEEEDDGLSPSEKAKAIAEAQAKVNKLRYARKNLNAQIDSTEIAGNRFFGALPAAFDKALGDNQKSLSEAEYELRKLTGAPKTLEDYEREYGDLEKFGEEWLDSGEMPDGVDDDMQEALMMWRNRKLQGQARSRERREREKNNQNWRAVDFTRYSGGGPIGFSTPLNGGSVASVGFGTPLNGGVLFHADAKGGTAKRARASAGT